MLDRELLHNPYTDLSAADIRRKWGEVQQAVPRRDSQLQSELKRQQSETASVAIGSPLCFQTMRD